MEETRRRTLHGRRRGKKLRVGQQSLLDTLLPRLALALPAEPQKIDLLYLFGGRLPPGARGERAWGWGGGPASPRCCRASPLPCRPSRRRSIFCTCSAAACRPTACG